MADDMFSDAVMAKAAEDAERVGYGLVARRYRAALRVPVEARAGLFRDAADAARPGMRREGWLSSSVPPDPVRYTAEVEAWVEAWLAGRLGVAS